MILALDSSSERLILGLADNGRVLGSFCGPPDRSHSERIVTEIDSLLRAAGVASNRIDTLAAVTGPGSFTGLRVGIASLLGLAKAWNKEILGGGTQVLHRLFLEKRGIDAVTLIHCRAEQFYLSDSSGGIEVMSADEIVSHYPDRIFAGPGAERFAEVAGADRRQHIHLAQPVSYGGGDLAKLFVDNRDQFSSLDPADLQINYIFKSQPEQKRDEAAMQITICEMAESDLDAITRIEKESFTDAWHRSSFEQDIASRWVITLAARSGDRCIGYANCVAVDDYGYLSNIAVDRELRSKGLGRMLLDELCGRLRASGRLRLLLDVRPSNQSAITFYEKYGFAILTRRQNFYTNPPEDSYTMILEFGN